MFYCWVYEKCNTAISTGSGCGKHLDMKESFVETPLPFKNAGVLVQSLLYWFTRSHGKFSVCVSAPKTNTFCSSAAAGQIPLKPHSSPLTLFLGNA